MYAWFKEKLKLRIAAMVRLVPASVSSGMLMSMMSRSITVGLSFLAMAICARILGSASFGIFAFALATMSFAVRVVTLGVPELTVRLIASSDPIMRGATAKSILGFGVGLTLILTLSVAALLFVWLFVQADVDPTLSESLIWALVLALPLAAASSNLSAVLNGLGRIGETVWIGEGLRLLCFLLATGLLFLLGRLAHTPSAFLQLTAFSYAVLTAVLVIRVVTAITSIKPVVKHTSVEVRAWSKAALPIGLFCLTTAAYQQVDVLIIQWLAAPHDVGLYYVAARSANLITFFLAGITVPLAPLIAWHHKNSGPAEIETLCNGSAKLLLATCLPLTASFVAFGGTYLTIVFGDGFRGAHPALAILAIGYLLKSVLELNQVIFFMSGSTRPILISNALGLVINAVGNMMLIPSFGITGAALATAFAMLVTGLIQWHIARKQLKINILLPGQRRERRCTT